MKKEYIEERVVKERRYDAKLILLQSSFMLHKLIKQLERIDAQSLPPLPLSMIKVYGKLSRGLSSETTEIEMVKNKI